MKFCTHCGAPVESEDIFCSKCGRKVSGRADERSNGPEGGEREPQRKVSCELAYTGTLFWLPLLICPHEKYARYHANQGLWLLILSVLGCTAIRLLSALNRFLAGGLLGAVFGGIYSLLFLGFLFGMLFLLWSAVTRAMAIHRREAPRPILFFEQAAILKERKEVS